MRAASPGPPVPGLPCDNLKRKGKSKWWQKPGPPCRQPRRIHIQLTLKWRSPSLPIQAPLTSVSQATGHIAAQRGHLFPGNLGPASIISYQGHHWDLQGGRGGGQAKAFSPKAWPAAGERQGQDLCQIRSSLPSPPLRIVPRTQALSFPWVSPPSHLVSDEGVKFDEAIAKRSIPKQAPDLRWVPRIAGLAYGPESSKPPAPSTL